VDLIEVRQVREDEVSAVGEMTVEAYRIQGPLQDDPDGGGYAAEVRDAARRAQESEVLVAVDGASLLGTVTFATPGSPWSEIAGPDEAEFRMLAVTPAARSRGVGTLLVCACLARARELGCRQLVLSTAAWTPGAHRLYERLGFVRAAHRDWEPHPGIRLLVYVRAVDGTG